MGMRPNYHISPKHGFLNDPNGLAQFQGKYHVFYQWLPDVVPQGNKIWRHCVSEDLIHWSDQGCGLKPGMCMYRWWRRRMDRSTSRTERNRNVYHWYSGNAFISE